MRYAEDPTTPGFWELSVDAQDFPGLLHGIARLLHQLGLEVVRSEVRTDDGVAHDQFVLTAEAPEQIPARLSEFERALIELVSGSGDRGSNGKAPARPEPVPPSAAKPRRTRLFGGNQNKPRSLGVADHGHARPTSSGLFRTISARRDSRVTPKRSATR